MNTEECSEDVYKHGESMGLYDMPKEKAEALCERLTLETGRVHDWHYIGGRVHIKALPADFYGKQEKNEEDRKDGPWA